jgi:two-component system, response regulator RegA
MCRVYLVEDSPLLVTRIARALEETGTLQVVGTAARADVAIEDLSSLRPDLAVVDLQLEQGTGWDVVDAAYRAGIRVVVLSNYGAEVFRTEAEARGVAFFDKSTEFEIFLSAVGRYGSHV